MRKVLRKAFLWSITCVTTVFTFVPEKSFEQFHLLPDALKTINWVKDNATEIDSILSRIAFLLLVWLVSVFVVAIVYWSRKRVELRYHNSTFSVEYGDLLSIKNAKKVITFDECFTTSIGNSPSDVKKGSLCGQYLSIHPIDNMKSLISQVGLKPLRTKSRFRHQECYEPGTLIPDGDYLYMAFAKLDENGLGTIFSREDYCKCLDHLWKEIDKYFGQEDVCIPVLGSGRTRFVGGSGENPSQQELLDIIICSYKLSQHKIKAPYKLRIICQKNNDFSINKVMQ